MQFIVKGLVKVTCEQGNGGDAWGRVLGGGGAAPVPPWAGHRPRISSTLTIQGFVWRFLTEV